MRLKIISVMLSISLTLAVPNLTAFASNEWECQNCGTLNSGTYCGTETKVDSNIAVGDIVTYGIYEQDGNTSNGEENIEWIVLGVQGDQALLISKYGLDAVQYNEESVSSTWETCTLRQWLNHDFLNAAFTAEEKDGIVRTTVVTDDNLNRGTEDENNKEDYIFCLSLEEAEEYLKSKNERTCHPTQYAIDHGVYMSGSGQCWWWLRSPGDNTSLVASVNVIGALTLGGDVVNDGKNAVRPALWVKISKLES